jgi:putative ABC transport system substrate-binding protein
MRRRDFIAGLGSAAGWPLGAGAQQPQVVGFIEFGKRQERIVAAFRQGLKETGFIEGQNVVVEYRFAENRVDRLQEIVADLVGRNVAAIATIGGPAAGAVKAATSRIPIVFGVGSNPVLTSLVASLARPGGNLTGVNSFIAELLPKQIDLIVKLVPNTRVLGILAAGSSLEQLRQEVQPMADAIGRKLLIITATTPQELDKGFAMLAEPGVEALVVRASPLTYDQREQIAGLAAHYSIPTVYPFRENAEAGGLMSYGINIDESARQVGIYVGRILKGERPADLPVVQPTKFEFVINLRTAKTLGLAIPPSILALADEVIE